MSIKLWAVESGGPTLGGVVALFETEHRAEDYARLKNREGAFSQNALNDGRGISKAWLMGDGLYTYREITISSLEDMPKIFDWESDYY